MDRFGSMSHFLVFSLLYLDWFRIILHNIFIKTYFQIPVVPHKAVAEVSK